MKPMIRVLETGIKEEANVLMAMGRARIFEPTLEFTNTF
jgi:hypothetical protein